MRKPRVARHEVSQPLHKSYRFIPLTRGQNAIVDAEDFEWLTKWNWFAAWDVRTHSFRAVRKGVLSGRVYMHREILGCKTGEEADHKNHDTLDNRRGNLRASTTLQNKQNKRMLRPNSSGFKGVYSRNHGKWEAQITANGRKYWLGTFDDPKEAARAYDSAAIRLHGEFAFLNFHS